ncbi:MAG: DUF167 domain-containing protein [Mariprofundales bacterium]
MLTLPEGMVVVGNDGLYLRVHAQPGARKIGVRGLHGDAVKIAVREVAESGKANKAIALFVAKALGLARCDVTVVSGHTSRAKRLLLRGDDKEVMLAMMAWLDANVHVD